MDKTKILIVDDEKYVLQIYAHILQEHDITLESYPLQAIELIQNKVFDIIIADYIMPVMNGIKFLETVRDYYKHRHYVSVLCTAHGTTYLFESDQQKGLFQFFLEKAFTPVSLEKVITQTIDVLQKACAHEK